MASLSTKQIEHEIKFGPFRFRVEIFDIYAHAEHEVIPGEYHCIERGHSMNGYFPDDYEVQPDTVEVEEAFIEVPFLTRFFGPFLSETLHEKIQDRYDDEICEMTAQLIAESGPYDFDWDFD